MKDAANNWYVSQTTTYLNNTQPNQTWKQTTRTMDRYGNVTQMQQYDWGASTPSRTYTNTWLHGADGNPTWADPLYYRNRLLTSTVNDGTHTVTLVSNSYSYPRALLSTSTTPTTSSTYTWDSYGNVTGQTVNGVSTSITMDPSHNYVVPSSIATGSNSAALQWSSFLGLTQNTGQNGDTAQISYDGNGFPATTVSPYGATTTNAYTVYSQTGQPSTLTSTTNTHFTRQTLDGVGHVKAAVVVVVAVFGKRLIRC